MWIFTLTTKHYACVTQVKKNMAPITWVTEGKKACVENPARKGHPTFLTSSLVMLILLVLGPHPEQGWSPEGPG